MMDGFERVKLDLVKEDVEQCRREEKREDRSDRKIRR